MKRRERRMVSFDKTHTPATVKQRSPYTMSRTLVRLRVMGLLVVDVTSLQPRLASRYLCLFPIMNSKRKIYQKRHIWWTLQEDALTRRQQRWQESTSKQAVEEKIATRQWSEVIACLVSRGKAEYLVRCYMLRDYARKIPSLDLPQAAEKGPNNGKGFWLIETRSVIECKMGQKPVLEGL